MKNKAQSLIIQFLLFFVIGFMLFIAIGNLFKNQSDIFRIDIINQSMKMTASYLASHAVNVISSCKQCDYVVTHVRLQNQTANYILDIDLNNAGFNVSIPYEAKYYLTSAHNLQHPLSPLSVWSGHAASAQPITLTYNRTKNELRVA